MFFAVNLTFLQGLKLCRDYKYYKDIQPSLFTKETKAGLCYWVAGLSCSARGGAARLELGQVFSLLLPSVGTAFMACMQAPALSSLQDSPLISPCSTGRLPGSPLSFWAFLRHLSSPHLYTQHNWAWQRLVSCAFPTGPQEPGARSQVCFAPCWVPSFWHSLQWSTEVK